VLGVLGIGLLVALLRRTAYRRARRSARLGADQRRAQVLWRRARERLGRAGLTLTASVSPREAARRTRERRPAAAEAVEEIASAVLAARWGGEPLAATRARALLRDLRRQLDLAP
jgi:hypothetical protein